LSPYADVQRYWWEYFFGGGRGDTVLAE
jgi:hypothetical protein